MLPVFEFLLSYFEKLEKKAKAGDFDEYPGIQSLITLAWNTTISWYKKTDHSLAWIASMVLYPRFKFTWFDQHWTSPGEARTLNSAKTKIRKLWEKEYRDNGISGRTNQSPEPEKTTSYLEDILNQMAPSNLSRPERPTRAKDELYLYLAEPPTNLLGVMEYWKARESEWPHLAKMAYDFLSIPAMSSECERVFSSCAKMTTSESSRLSGKSLWHHECLKNWQRRGAIMMETFGDAIILKLV